MAEGAIPVAVAAPVPLGGPAVPVTMALPVAAGLYPTTGVAPPVATGLAPPVAAQPIGPLTLTSGTSFPAGLVATLQDGARNVFPLRVWVVDNSGSMQTGDGSRLVKDAAGNLRTIKATRWQELADIVLAQAELATALGARTDFHLLTPTPQGQFWSTPPGGLAAHMPPLGETVDLPTLRRKLASTSPGGTTPLTESVMQIVSMISAYEPQLRASGQQVAVILATDGLPNNPPSFLQALQQLQKLPVWVVVRLCTDQDDVVEYWNDLDRQLEAPLEVLDDVKGEAAEVRQKNAWLTYAPALHHAREFGLHEKLFDLLDEQRLLPTQVKELCEKLLGTELPEPELDLAHFKAVLSEALGATPAVYEPVSGRVKPWVDLAVLEQHFDPDAGNATCTGAGGGSGCVIS